ncbi:MAG: hypothetical protein V1944_02755 [Candidatus Aenigmatarchaeota archaeon]
MKALESSLEIPPSGFMVGLRGYHRFVATNVVPGDKQEQLRDILLKKFYEAQSVGGKTIYSPKAGHLIDLKHPINFEDQVQPLPYFTAYSLSHKELFSELRKASDFATITFGRLSMGKIKDYTGEPGIVIDHGRVKAYERISPENWSLVQVSEIQPDETRIHNAQTIQNALLESMSSINLFDVSEKMSTA